MAKTSMTSSILKRMATNCNSCHMNDGHLEELIRSKDRGRWRQASSPVLRSKDRGRSKGMGRSKGRGRSKDRGRWRRRP